MRQYIFTIVLTFAGILLLTLAVRIDTSIIVLPETLNIRFYELALGIVIVVAVIMTVTTSNVLVAIIGLGVVGYSVAMIFMLFSAPDLAMTQFAVETLSVVLFVLVLYRLPDFKRLTPETSRTFDIILSSAVGILIAGMVFIVNLTPLDSQVTPYFLANSYPAALGRNVVNVILVDFRSMDTMGEIIVIAVAAIGVFALLQLTPKEEKEQYGSD
jgi:multicomponent Na+:H+ antiporter subunit A